MVKLLKGVNLLNGANKMSNNSNITYPTFSDYQDLMLNPSLVLFDSELKKGKVKTDNLGLPID